VDVQVYAPTALAPVHIE